MLFRPASSGPIISLGRKDIAIKQSEVYSGLGLHKHMKHKPFGVFSGRVIATFLKIGNEQ
jgi:hypothetical protein